MRELISGFAAVVIFARLQEMGLNMYWSLIASVLFGGVSGVVFGEMAKKDRPRYRRRAAK